MRFHRSLWLLLQPTHDHEHIRIHKNIILFSIWMLFFIKQFVFSNIILSTSTPNFGKYSLKKERIGIIDNFETVHQYSNIEMTWSSEDIFAYTWKFQWIYKAFDRRFRWILSVSIFVCHCRCIFSPCEPTKHTRSCRHEL